MSIIYKMQHFYSPQITLCYYCPLKAGHNLLPKLIHKKTKTELSFICLLAPKNKSKYLLPTFFLKTITITQKNTAQVSEGQK